MPSECGTFQDVMIITGLGVKKDTKEEGERGKTEEGEQDRSKDRGGSYTM